MASNWSFLASAIELETSAGIYRLKIPIRVLSPAKNLIGLLPGQTISGRAVLVKSKEARVAALVLFHGEVKIETTASPWAHSLGAIRIGLRNASGDGDAGALIPGMVLGDTSKQSAEFKLAMKRSGLTHLVAVSGANFAIVSGFVLWLMQFLFRNRKLSNWCNCAFANFLYRTCSPLAFSIAGSCDGRGRVGCDESSACS